MMSRHKSHKFLQLGGLCPPQRTKIGNTQTSSNSVQLRTNASNKLYVIDNWGVLETDTIDAWGSSSATKKNLLGAGVLIFDTT